MKFKDKVRFCAAKMFFKKTILFSQKTDWELPIKNEIKGKNNVSFFYEFNEVNPDMFDLVIPLSIHAQKYINSHLEHLKGHKVMVPSDAAMDLCNDKEKFAIFLKNNGFADYIPKTNENFKYPYVLKKKIGVWGEGVNVVKDATDERALSKEAESGDYFRQEYVEGKEEYTTHIIITNGKIVFYKTLKFTFGDRYFVKGMNCNHLSMEVVDHGHLKDLFGNILNKLEYQGICCFNYKLCDGEARVFEINPRYGGTMTVFVNDALTCYRDTLNMHEVRGNSVSGVGPTGPLQENCRGIAPMGFADVITPCRENREGTS